MKDTNSVELPGGFQTTKKQQVPKSQGSFSSTCTDQVPEHLLPVSLVQMSPSPARICYARPQGSAGWSLLPSSHPLPAAPRSLTQSGWLQVWRGRPAAVGAPASLLCCGVNTKRRWSSLSVSASISVSNRCTQNSAHL